MASTDPVPIGKPFDPGSRFRWKVNSRLKIKIEGDDREGKAFDKVLGERRSERVIADIGIEPVAAAIREVFKIQEIGVDDLQGRARKAILSSGALHPIEPIVIPSTSANAPILYDDISDSFLELSVDDKKALARFQKKSSQVLPSAQGYLVVLTGDMRRVASQYEAPESLLWRDAGAALQALSMVCNARNLACCPLGILGADAVFSITGNRQGPEAVGVVAIGGCEV